MTSEEPVAGPDSGERRERVVGTRRAVLAIKAEHAADRSRMEIVADRLTRSASSPFFFLFHVIWFAGWIIWNVGAFGFRPFDPFPFGLLTMVVSLEAIFLSIFVLMAQGRESQIAELREEVTLQVLLRSEEEITKVLQLMAGLYGRLGHKVAEDHELREMLQPLSTRDIERQLIQQIHRTQEMRIARRKRKRRGRKKEGTEE
ncbi:MAG: DUF1003 domain-containing protein [Anaerolineae bacterium]|nr:DUF1003 domain-containing protein [Gemmatimonadaceae bacterium]